MEARITLRGDDMVGWLRDHMARRPIWMNALLLFCVYMALVYLPWDIFVKPIAEDEEVWFGILFRGWAAKLLAFPHWAVYAAGMIGFWGMRSWMWPWASVYVAQVAFSMAVWPILQRGDALGWIIGAAAGAVFAIPTVALWRARDRFQGPLQPLRQRYGEWALVTGASSGIGAAFARALARDGVSCVLTARREDRLRSLADELEKRHQVATRVVTLDLGVRGGADQLAEAVSDLEISILVNNAGFGCAGPFEKQDRERMHAMVELNCMAPTALTASLLPGMCERGRGAVIMVGSIAGSQPLPLHALYSGTKAFVNILGESLWGELQGSGVDCLAVLPGTTETEFQAVSGELPHGGESADSVVAKSLDALGRKPSLIPGVYNWLRGNAGTRLLPRSVLAIAARIVMARRIPQERR
jgi:short-subunit dehydrogenase